MIYKSMDKKRVCIFPLFFCCIFASARIPSVNTSLDSDYTLRTLKYVGVEVGAERVSVSSDSSKVLKTLKIAELLSKIESAHPLVHAYRFESKIGKASLLASRGEFDPRFVVQTSEKETGQLPYYSRESFELKLPTATPLQFETGVESGRGSFVNPELYTPSGGLSYAGVSLPILKGLITDSRRTTLAKAKTLRSQTIEIQKIQLLELSQSIWKDYLDWLIAHEQEKAYLTGVALSTERQEALRIMFEAGGCNGMDTLENFIQLELFQTLAKEWNANTFKQRLQLSRHLWDLDLKNDTWKPLLISEDVVPDLGGIEVLDSLFKNALLAPLDLLQLPDLKNIEWEVEQKRLDLRLKKWDLLPQFDIKYQQLFKGVYQEYQFGQDRRFGLHVSAPLFLRKERGDYLISKFEFTQKNDLFRFKTNETGLKINALKQQVNLYKDVYVQLKNIEKGYLTLFELEREKFDSGDGTIFLLNTRENRYLNAKIKTIEQLSKYQHSIIDFLRETGTLSHSIFGLDGL